MEWAIQITKKTHFLKFIVDPHLDIKSRFIYFSFFVIASCKSCIFPHCYYCGLEDQWQMYYLYYL